MPLLNWEECEKGNVQFVNKHRKSTKHDVNRWANLYNQYLDRFGLGHNFEEIIRLKRKLIRLRCAYIENGNKKLLNQIIVDEKKLLSLEGGAIDGLTIDETLIHLSKWLGYRIDKKVISIVEYKSLLDEYGRTHKKK